jgi:putative ATP-binding cassette transporter
MLPSEDPAAARQFRLDPAAARRFLELASGYWGGKTRLEAWLLVAAIAATLSLSLAATVALNTWQRWFFDALERKDAATALNAVGLFVLIIASMAAVGVGIVLSRETLQVRWRAWLVRRVSDAWLADDGYYRLADARREPANPEYRIADDSRWATEPLVDLAMGLFSAVIGAAAFISILWSVGGSLTVSLGEGSRLTIPAYMVWLALGYGALASTLMVWVGHPLVAAVGAKNAAEGELRFALMRLRENSESVALMGGSRFERTQIDGTIGRVVGRWLAIVRRHGHVTWITNSSGPMIPIVPLLFAAPRYFAGELSLGEVVQLATAFVQVQLAISWVVDNFNRVAEWYASARRVLELWDACTATPRDPLAAPAANAGPGMIMLRRASEGRLELNGLRIEDGDGRLIVEVPDLVVAPGERVQVIGGSSSGKSTLVRAIAGLASRGSGRIVRPAGADTLILPQKSYLPVARLGDALIYPTVEARPGDDEVRAALAAVGLGELAGRLDEQRAWQLSLAVGDQQRLGLARIFLARPKLAILDDAVGSLDEAAITQAFTALASSRPGITLVAFTQRRIPGPIFARTFSLDRTTVPA